MTKRFDFFNSLKDKLLKDCSLCDHSGWREMNGTSSICSCLSRFESYVELDDAGIDREYWDISFDNWKGDGLALRKVQEYIQHIESAYKNGLGMVFYGNNGTGKSMLSVQILRAALSRGYSIRFITMAEVTALMKSKIDKPDIDGKFYEDKVKNAEFLCLDNLGSEYKPQNFGTYTMAEFDILSRYRRRNLLPTLITSNLSDSEFISNYGSSISSLFSASSQFVRVEGKDFRQEQGNDYLSKLKELK